MARPGSGKNRHEQLSKMIDDEIKKLYNNAIKKIMKIKKFDVNKATKYINNMMDDINVKYKHLSELDKLIKLQTLI